MMPYVTSNFKRMFSQVYNYLCANKCWNMWLTLHSLQYSMLKHITNNLFQKGFAFVIYIFLNTLSWNTSYIMWFMLCWNLLSVEHSDLKNEWHSVICAMYSLWFTLWVETLSFCTICCVDSSDFYAVNTLWLNTSNSFL